MGFERFDSKHARARGVAALRFYEGGKIHFNSAAARLLEGVTHVELLYDVETRRIAFKPTGADERAGYKVTPAASQLQVAASAFCRTISAPLGVGVNLYQEDDLFVATLPPAPTVAS